MGITSISERDLNDDWIAVYRAMKDELNCRVYITYSVDAQAPMDKIRRASRQRRATLCTVTTACSGCGASRCMSTAAC